MPSDGKSSHCLWQGELKKLKLFTNFIYQYLTEETGIHILIFFLANLARQYELLPSLGVRRLSSVYFSHFNLLL
jgi:hypothetical protein